MVALLSPLLHTACQLFTFRVFRFPCFLQLWIFKDWVEKMAIPKSFHLGKFRMRSKEKKRGCPF